MIGFSELGLVFLIILLTFGATRIPAVGASLGKGIRNFRKALKGEDEIDVTPNPQKIAEGTDPKKK